MTAFVPRHAALQPYHLRYYGVHNYANDACIRTLPHTRLPYNNLKYRKKYRKKNNNNINK